jgi:protein-S-isoprenylcysteine O-methyltransferase Ste14
MNIYLVAVVELLACWILWAYPFLCRAKRAPKREAVVTAKASRYGVLLQSLGFLGAWLRTAPEHPPPLSVLSMLLGPLSTLCAWWAVMNLGKQWRIQAGLYADHELIRSGPYQVVRHPIYASMLGMLLATGLLFARWWILALALIPFLAGTEIRVRAEDELLASWFGEEFERYKARVRAYVPWVR